MQKPMSFVMSLRIRTRDVGLALWKLDKWPLDSLRKVGSINSSTDSTARNEKYEKCKRLIEKTFGVTPDSVTFASTTEQNEAEPSQKLETIAERPLVEDMHKVEGLTGAEEEKPHWEHQIQQNFHFNRFKRGFDEVACKMMNVPAKYIDEKLLEVSLEPRMVDVIDRDICAQQIDEDIDEDRECDEHTHKSVERTREDLVNIKYSDKYSPLTGPWHSIYDLHLDTEAERTWIAEKYYPTHMDVEYPEYIEKTKEMALNKFAETFRHDVLSYDLSPLPPNETSISSQSGQFEARIKNRKDIGVLSSRKLVKYLHRRARRHASADQNKPEQNDVGHPGPPTIQPTLSKAPSNQSTITQQVAGTAVPLQGHDTVQDEEIPLSELLRKVRLRNKIEQEIKKKHDHRNKPTTLWSKSTCLPPLDMRPRSVTCPPSPCRPKKNPPAKKAMPCPPVKKTPCPAPPKRAPSDPCKPKPPCTPRKSPCGFYSGNKYKDTITFILCGFNSSNMVRQAYGLPLLWNFANSAIIHSPCRCITTSPTLSKTSLEIFKSWDISADKTREDGEINFARSFEPWAPIPSWPMPTKVEKKSLVCPKDGCKLPKTVPPYPPSKFSPCTFNTPLRKR